MHPAISLTMPTKARPILNSVSDILIGAGGMADQMACLKNTLGAEELAARCPSGSAMVFSPSSSLFGPGQKYDMCKPAGCIQVPATEERGIPEVCHVCL